MLYKLLLNFSEVYPFLNVFKYITFRSMLAIVTSLGVCLMFGDAIINKLKLYQNGGQPIRDDGPQTHFAKRGTPTMGGLIMLLSILVSVVLWGNVTNLPVLAVLLCLFGFGALGFVDDYLKVSKRDTKGVSGKMKLIWQFILSSLAVWLIVKSNNNPEATMLTFPFLKDFMLELGWLYILFGAFVITGASNAVNLTDGLDGLAIGPIVIASACFGLICYVVGHSVWADYLFMTKVPEASEVAVIMGAIVGAGLGFLWFNCAPAQVFMGDVGSLGLGGAIGAAAVSSKHEIALAIIGGLFVIEALSVMIQVAYFKVTRRRFFLMAPIHHHYEKKGWPETKVVTRFWIISLIFAVVGIATLKLR